MRVVPVLCPGEGWDDLEVANGEVAALELHRVLIGGSPVDLARNRAALLAYCRTDTAVMVKLLHCLQLLPTSAASGET
jgi:hypothetical protein